MKTKIIPIYLGLLLMVMLVGVGWRVMGTPVASEPTSGPLNLFVSTVAWEGDNGANIASFVGAVKTGDEMNVFVATYLKNRYAGKASVKSIKTEPVAEETIQKLIQSRRGVRL